MLLSFVSRSLLQTLSKLKEVFSTTKVLFTFPNNFTWTDCNVELRDKGESIIKPKKLILDAMVISYNHVPFDLVSCKFEYW